MSGVELETPFDNSLACELLWEYPIVNLGRNEIRHCCRTNGQALKAEDIQKHGIR